MEIVLVRKVANPTAAELFIKYGDETITLFEAWIGVTSSKSKICKPM